MINGKARFGGFFFAEICAARRRRISALDNRADRLYTYVMSNYTDGKKALAAGEFDAAEKKLIKALDRRPDDGGLWWALFLCKQRCRDDGELRSSLVSEFGRAADDGAPPPKLPFDTTPCKNALGFDRDGRHRRFVGELHAELSDLWLSKRGRPLKGYKPTAEYRPKARCSALGFAAYALVALAALGAGLIVYGVSAAARWALWTGAVVFVLSTAASGAAGVPLKKRSGGAVAFGLLLGVFGVFAVALVIVGSIAGLQYASLIGGGVFAVLVAFLLLKVFRGGKDGGRDKGSRGDRGQKAPREKKSKIDDYSDDFD